MNKEQYAELAKSTLLGECCFTCAYLFQNDGKPFCKKDDKILTAPVEKYKCYAWHERLEWLSLMQKADRKKKKRGKLDNR